MCTGPTGHHYGSWRHPESDAHQVLEAARYENLAIWIERGLLDGLFIVDYQHVPGLDEGRLSEQIPRGGHMSLLEPLLVLTAMARVTQHIGLTATMSTTLIPPYHIARSFATLDHLSGGRAGWNIVTSLNPNEALNYGLERLPEKNARYDHADEVVEACMGLWETWDEGAIRVDRQAGVFADRKGIHYRSYAGSTLWARGGLTTPRSPQGHPVLMQAGGSPRGLDFAARWAEVIFTLQHEPAGMRRFYGELKERVRSAGRAPQDCLIFPSIDVSVSETEREAKEQAEELDRLVVPELGLAAITQILGTDVSALPLDTPMTEIPLPPGEPRASTYENYLGLTLGEVAWLVATTDGTPRLVGTPSMVVDQMQELFESECCDGFIISFALNPRSLIQFVELVVPEMQRRGIHRERYLGRTFRENLRS
jgi:FMN-dependent oxidoreductase (nitrilotriacetate monooxygenase family)